MTSAVTIPARFNGPPGSAHGGYACGVVADAIGLSASVRLSAPPPLDVPLARTREPDGTVRLLHGDTLVAIGKPATPAIAAPEAPAWATASLATREYVGHVRERHPFPGCFACGPDREADGLRIWPGPAGPDGLVACAWRPEEELASGRAVDAVFVWAALDCPAGIASIPPGTPAVLGTMTARLQAPVLPGRDYIVAGWPLGSAGRMHRAGAALYERGGRRVALAESLWITPR
jgi:hypothetical protein